MKHNYQSTRRQIVLGSLALVPWPPRWASAQKLLIPFSNKSLDYYFFVIEEAAVKRAVEANQGSFQATNASFDNTRQLEQWQSLMLSRPAALVLDPIDSQAIVSGLRRYNQQKIPVAIIDTPAESGNVAITVSFDNRLGGVMAAREIINRLIKSTAAPRARCSTATAHWPAWPGASARRAWMPSSPSIPASPTLPDPPKASWTRCCPSPWPRCPNIPIWTPCTRPAIRRHAASPPPCSRRTAGRRSMKGPRHLRHHRWRAGGAALDQDGYMDACVSQDPIAYGEVAVEMLVKYSIPGKEVPSGRTRTRNTSGRRARSSKGQTGPTLIIPPFVIDRSNAADQRHWGYVAEKVWGIAYTYDLMA
jgi:simple sugar transport system substrate-binding protein/ribose transport system substrate-binding protein